ncbi:hypothetical protein IVB40_07710 [Bradyrhizobium sp. 40]|uniref:hypothetical protein n=1 Tax=Bradyrhizobium sp. 40 TaxID=2782674 RepID=UPI001FFFFCFD|nr:hypothetical protein [Bradyrhizobium sp. 40]UPJ43946.1 hypothetical protein IVB40_07710 [Bradyrhizobium sp. 40]
MTSGLFWDLATSDVALAIVAVILIASFVVSRVPFVSMIPAIAPYVVLAGFVTYLALAGLMLCVGYRLSDERAALRQLKIDLDWSESQLEQQKATAEDKAQLAKEKAAEAEDLKGKVDGYEQRLAAQPVGDCGLDDGDLDGLRALRGRAKQPDGRHPSRLRGLGGASRTARP